MRRELTLAAVVCLAASAVVGLARLGTEHPRGILPKVYAQDGCSLATLHGSYGFAGDEFFTSGPVPASIIAFTPVAAIGVDTFDGAGNLSGSITASFGGSISTSPLSGTYTVNADCTGSATVTESNGGFVIHFSFVIVDHGRQLRNLATDPGAVSFATAIKQDAPDGCSLETLHGSYGFAGDGFITTGPVPASISGSIPLAVMGVDTFDGAGKVSGFITASIGGSISTSTFSGPYTVNADCTGSGSSNLSNGFVAHLSFVIVDHGRQLLIVQTDPGVVAFSTAVKE